MKDMLRISILANLALLAAVILLLSDRRKENVAVTAAGISEQKRQTTEPDPAESETSPFVKAKPFRWSQLESADYQNYVANLRGIGCPEQTICDIITADVDTGVFAARREQLKQKQITQAQQGLDAELQSLHNEETAMISTLLGWQVSSPRTAASSTPPRPPRRRSAEPPIAMPLVLQNLDLSGLKLTSDGFRAIDDLRQSFVEQIGGPGQDPNDPGYRERWQKAQANVNNRLEAMIGRQAYQAYQFKIQSAAGSQAEAGGEKP